MPYYSPFDFMDFMRFLKEPVTFSDYVASISRKRRKSKLIKKKKYKKYRR